MRAGCAANARRYDRAQDSRASSHGTSHAEELASANRPASISATMRARMYSISSALPDMWLYSEDTWRSTRAASVRMDRASAPSSSTRSMAASTSRSRLSLMMFPLLPSTGSIRSVSCSQSHLRTLFVQLAVQPDLQGSEERIDVTTTLFHNGTIWLGAEAEPAESLLVSQGVIAAIGTAEVDRHLASLSSDQDSIEHVDLDGGFLMPSFGDGHAHPIFGGVEAEGPQVRACSRVDELVAEVGRYAAAHPHAERITGAAYDGSLVAGGLFAARWLDEAVSDRPVVLRAWDYHTVWCNSRALDLAGITAETPEPEIGEIPRRDDGSPVGTLREWGAVDFVDAARPRQDETIRLRALERAANYYRRRGVTWVQDAWVEPADVDTYLSASAAQLLSIRFNLALYADPRHFAKQLPEML